MSPTPSHRGVPPEKVRALRALVLSRKFDAVLDEGVRLLRQHPGNADILSCLAHACISTNQNERALYFASQAEAARPNDLSLTAHVAHVLGVMGRRDEAEAKFRHVVAQRPDDANFYQGLVSILIAQRRYAEVEKLCRAGLAKRPDDAQLTTGLSYALTCLNDYAGAVQALEDAAPHHPTDLFLHNQWCFNIHHLPDASPTRVREVHEKFNAVLERLEPTREVVYPQSREPERRLRVGILSPDLCTNVVSTFLEPVFTHRDRERFELHGFLSRPIEDEVTRRLRGKCDSWHTFAAVSQRQVAERLREARLDVVIETAGHAKGFNLGALHLRPAPAQATYLGYAGTTGVRAIGWRIVDSITDPPGENDAHVTERLMRIDPCFLCFTPPPNAPEVSVRPTDGPITFGSFNAVRKLNQRVVAHWSRLLRAVPDARLVLKSLDMGEEQTQENLYARFAAEGIARDRVTLLKPFKPARDHLSQYAEIDIGLDPFPYNGTTTTCEAMWMGVPVVAMVGDRHAARVGMSLLSAVGLSDLIAHDEDHSIAITVALANDRTRLTALRSGLRERMRASVLMDEKAFAARFYDAVRMMWRAWCTSGEHRAAPQ